MSVFGKLFGAGGGKAGKGGPTPQEAIQRLRDTEEMLSKKQEFLEKKIEQELTAAKKHGTKNKRGESAEPPQTPLAGLHLRHTCSSVCSDPGTLSYLVRLPSLPFWFRDPSPSDCLQCLPEPWTPASSHCHSSPLVSGSPHSARPLQTLISQLFFLFFRIHSVLSLPPFPPPSCLPSPPPPPPPCPPCPPSQILPSPPWLLSALHPNTCVLPGPTPALSRFLCGVHELSLASPHLLTPILLEKPRWRGKGTGGEETPWFQFCSLAE